MVTESRLPTKALLERDYEGVTGRRTKTSEVRAMHRSYGQNRTYSTDSAGAQVTAAFALTWSRRALGAACLHMIALFPDIELEFSELVLVALKIEYRAED